GRSGSSAAATLSSMVWAAGSAVTSAAASASWRPKPSGLRSAIAVVPGRRREVAQPLHPGEDPPFTIVETFLDVRREQEPPAGRADPEGDRDRVLGLVADRDRDAGHAQLLCTLRRAAVEPDRGLARREPLDLDLGPADATNPEAEDLAHRLLCRPAAGEVLGPVA